MVHVVIDTDFSLFLKGLKTFLNPRLSMIVPLNVRTSCAFIRSTDEAETQLRHKMTNSNRKKEWKFLCCFVYTFVHVLFIQDKMFMRIQILAFIPIDLIS